MGISNLPGLLSHHRVSQGRFPTLVGPGPLNTVGHERLEYATPRSMFKGEDSMFFDRSDPLIQGVDLDSDILLDRYIAYRLAVGRPMSRQDFEETARYTETMLGYGSEVSKAIMARAERADTR
jgi:hypothetical protein